MAPGGWRWCGGGGTGDGARRRRQLLGDRSAQPSGRPRACPQRQRTRTARLCRGGGDTDACPAPATPARGQVGLRRVHSGKGAGHCCARPGRGGRGGGPGPQHHEGRAAFGWNPGPGRWHILFHRRVPAAGGASLFTHLHTCTQASGPLLDTCVIIQKKVEMEDEGEKE